MEQPSQHPLKTYLLGKKMAARDFVKLIAQHGVKTTPSYLSQIVIGHRHPSRVLAVAISLATDGEVSIDKLMTFDASAAA
jgi:hypothetical protein